MEENPLVKTVFYPDVRGHTSPSALASWLAGRSGFSKSYFAGEKFTGTAATLSGTLIHALIEGTFIKVIHYYGRNEVSLSFPVGNGVTLNGRPDSFGLKDGVARFVDYKSGKSNEWDDSELALDIKMRATAWLVWNELGKPERVEGFIELIPTRWNDVTKEIEPTGEDSIEVAKYVYLRSELEDFLPIVQKTIKDINEAYKRFLRSSDEFVDKEDVMDYAMLEAEIREREAKQEIIKVRIGDQMDYGLKETIATEAGSFYFTKSEEYEYPLDMKLYYKDMGLTYADFLEISASFKVAVQYYKILNNPKAVSRSLAFKPKQKK